MPCQEKEKKQSSSFGWTILLLLEKWGMNRTGNYAKQATSETELIFKYKQKLKV